MSRPKKQPAITLSLPLPVLSLTLEQTQAALGIKDTTLRMIRNRPKEDPTRIATTSYGTVSVKELERHLAAEMARAQDRE